MHVFLDRNIWQASIMLVTNQTHLKDEELLENWDCLDNWGMLEDQDNITNGKSLDSNTSNRNNLSEIICPNLNNNVKESSEAQNTSMLGERQLDMLPCENVIFASIIDGSESEYQDDDKDSRKTSVVHGSPSESNDFLV